MNSGSDLSCLDPVRSNQRETHTKGVAKIRNKSDKDMLSSQKARPVSKANVHETSFLIP